MNPENIKVGIIGGSGMEDPAFITDYSIKNISTPYGPTSSELIVGSIENFPVVIISRHGKDHSINPTNVNYRANIHALKEQNCTHILAVTACGSLREHIKPGHFIFPDQFIGLVGAEVDHQHEADKGHAKHQWNTGDQLA